ncbi:MAG: reverse transcriptase domain-containing protein, partial [Terriglobia bacterium]
LKAVRKHVQEKWVVLYIERWLKAPMQLEDGTRLERDRGTPQGGVVSPVLANLFLHYAFDAWMGREYPGLPWCRYADDGLVHCRTLKEAEAVKAKLQERLAACHLEMHPTKTRIVYCKDKLRKGNYPIKTFDFLGYTFRPRVLWDRKRKEVFDGFTPAVSKAALRSMRKKVRELDFRKQTQMELRDIARRLNPILRGWIEYYGHYNPSALYPLYRYINQTLVAWAGRKYKRFRRHKTRAGKWAQSLPLKCPHLFEHWSRRTIGTFA